MAETISPVVSHSIDYQKSPVTDPPRTEFPYPEEEKPKDHTPRERVDSETTLTEGTAPDSALNPNSARPLLSTRKYETELSRPVGTRPVVGYNHRHSTGGRPNESSPLKSSQQDDASSSDSESSEDEEHVDLNPQRSRPERNDLNPRELNRARMRPWHEHKDRKRQKVTVGNEHFKTQGKVAKDGRLNVKISEMANTGYLAKALGNALQSHLHPTEKKAREDAEEMRRRYDSEKHMAKIPPMNIVIMVIGSRGDIQPFLKIGQILKEKHGHRVRIATHPAFRKFVQEEIGLEFFSIGGDPSELMSFMVRNPGLIPSFETLTSGEVGRRRDSMFDMFNGFWRACINTTDDEKDTANLKMLGNKSPFIADAIIANPVSFAHYHCAERLGIPLHLVFTFPYTPTTSFPHPLANIKSTNVDREYTNYMSYPLVELMQWQGLGDIINRFRVKTLGLEPVSTLWAPGQLTRMRVPMTYLWSPALVPKPEDWGPEIDIAGYVFLDLAKSYKPPEDLVKFLERPKDDPRPIIYIGFGSIAGIKDAKAFCKLIFGAVTKANVRAIVSRGWGGMGDGMDVPDEVYLIDNVPHDWLFPQVDAVVHHGGAGTCAAGFKFGKPTAIVPFFGDQPFWANMVARSKAGARSVYGLKDLDIDKLATSIKECLEPESKDNAEKIAKSIAADGDGAENAVDSFHRGLSLAGHDSIRCDVFNDRLAVWRLRHTDMRLSALAADLLVENKRIKWDDLELLRHKKWADFSGPGEPITGTGGVVVAAFQEALHGLTSIHDTTKADLQKIEDHKQKKRSKKKAATESDSNSAEQNIQINLSGEAEPIRKPTIGGLASDPPKERQTLPRSDTTSTLQQPAPVIVARDVGRGVGHSLKSVVMLPSEMLHALTLGFRNAPRLYGDRTVRPPPQTIQGFRHGSKVAGQELFLGFYDGTTGLVRIPYLDVREDGMTALPKGVARGFGGLVLKPIAGTLGLVDYTNRGIYASLRRRFKDTEKTNRWIRRVRLAQGSLELRKLRSQEDEERKKQIRGAKSNPNAAGELERARSKALTRFTSYDRKELDKAREKENRPSIFVPRLSKSDRGSKQEA